MFSIFLSIESLYCSVFSVGQEKISILSHLAHLYCIN